MDYTISAIAENKFKDELLAIWENNLKDIIHNHFEWFYKQNPAGKPVTVIAFDDNGVAVGSCSLYVRNFHYNKQRIRIGIASDFAINKEHRVFGPALKMQRLLTAEGIKQGFDLLFAFPNPNSSSIFKRIGYKKLGKIYSGIKIIKSRKWVFKKVKNKFLCTLISSIIDSFSFIYDQFAYLTSGASYQLSFEKKGLKEYDLLWERAKNNYSIIGEKEGSYLKWRYWDNPSKKYQLINIYNDKNDIIGFIIYSKTNNKVILEEIFLETPNYKITKIIAKFIRFIRGHNVEQISFGYLGSIAFINSFKKNLFFIKPITRSCYIFPVSQSLVNAKDLFNRNNWLLFESEMDI